ncbi:MAG: dihydroorotate dehydrogenase electron transfer subunit [Candidatus Omnitrophica bacterium]|nr:dihydroorotate dehydrogenase electron transfer subunit [Candidatus Omnitrophota bacterium]
MKQLQNIYKVIANEQLCPRFYRLAFDAPQLAREAQPGQFVHIRTSLGLQPFFRRPFSIYRAQKYVEIFYEPVGQGTQLLASKIKGDDLDVLGPLGTPFTLPSKEIKQVVMVAGGIGIAPFLALSDVLKKKKFELVLLYGGRTKNHVYPMKEFKANGVKVFVATDDGSVGFKGRVSGLFSKVRLDPQTTRVYTCGPNPMMAAVQKFCIENNLPGEAACEEIMACGLGACLGCSIPTKSGYKTVCYDGPCFDIKEVMFH